MTLAKTLESWLASRRAWLLNHGASLLALDPAREKLVLDISRFYGLAIEVDGQDLIPVFGLPFRDDGVEGRSQLNAINGCLASIVYDEPVETVHAAVDSLARFRASRRCPDTQWKSGFMRLPAVLPHFIARVGQGATLSYEEARTTFGGLRGGAMSWVNGTEDGRLQTSISRDAPGLVFTCDDASLTAHNLWLGCKHDVLLNLCPFRGQLGWHYGSLQFDGRLPETMAHAAIGRPLRSLASYSLTDPFDLRIVQIHDFGERVMILFSGAEELRRYETLFEEPAFMQPYLCQLAALRHARDALVANLTMALLPNSWWDRFRKASRKPGAPMISSSGPLMTNHHWVE